MEETDDERRRRLKRERTARWRAKNPERVRVTGREARARWLAEPENQEKNREASRRWLAKPENRERVRERNARWQAANPERAREASARWHTQNRERSLLNACRSSARQRGHDCSLTLADVEGLLRPMRCSATGLPLSWEWDGPGANPWAPSLDRIDCSDGYHLDNVRPVCWAFNRARGDWPDVVVMELARALAARR